MNAAQSNSAAMNFSWLEEYRIAGCRGPRTNADLRFLASVGVGALVRLACEDETGITCADVERHGIEDFYEPVEDYTPPSQKQIDRVLIFIRRALKSAKAIAVSCGAGYGRAGTILACYLVLGGLTADEAIWRLIAVRPCSDELLRVPGQKEAVQEFHRRLTS